MSNHTPGPWECGEEAGIWANGLLICQMRYFLNPKQLLKVCEKETQANARLIAAAPDLLEALKEYVKVMGGIHENECPQDDTCNCKWKYINDKVNQAISKAEGAK